MAEHPIEGLMQTAMENLKDMIDVNTIIGDPVETPDGSVILTVSKVGFGFAAGGSEFMLKQQSGSNQRDQNQSKGEPFGGGSGGGVSITPIAFLIVSAGDIKMIHLDNTTHLYERLLDLAPQAIEKVQSMLQNMNKDSKEKKDQSNGQQSGGQKQSSHSKNLFRSQQRGQQDDEKQDLNF